VSAYIFRRIAGMGVVLFAISLITFLLMHAVPGGPFDGEKRLPPDVVRNINAKYHLDEPLAAQYLTYMSNILVPQISQSDAPASQLTDALIAFSVGGTTFHWMNFGPTYRSTTRTVNDIFRENLPVSAQLGVLGLLVALAIGLPMGIIAALKHNQALDYLATGVAVAGISFPAIALGPLLITVFGLTLRWVPVSGWGSFAQAILPALTLGFGSSALIARLTRASLLEVIGEDYIRTAYAKGLRDRRVILVHALKNALIPVITIIGPLFAVLVTGSFVVETIFGIPGMGKYFVDSITNRDYPVIMGTVLLFAMLLVIANFAIDLIYGWLDPRIRFSMGRA